jgi:hypothetical protein
VIAHYLDKPIGWDFQDLEECVGAFGLTDRTGSFSGQAITGTSLHCD